MKMSELKMLTVLLCAQGLLVTHGRTSVKVLDLTYNIRENETLASPVYSPFNLTVLTKGYKEGGYYLAYNSYFTPEHIGTHMDAPYHIYQEGPTVDRIAIKNFFGPGAVIDISGKTRKNRDAVAEVIDIVRWEEENGKIPHKAVVLIRSGWGKYWPDPRMYQGRDGEDDLQLSFPGLDPAAAAWLVENRKIVGVGIDTGSIDNGVSTTFGSHVALSKAGIYILENVANMDQLPGPTGFTIIALPMKIYDGTGAPTRIVALTGNSQTTNTSSAYRPSIFYYLVAIAVFMMKANLYDETH